MATPLLSRVKQHDYPRLYSLLSPYLPHSLTILGPCEQHRDTSLKIPLWASFAVNEAPPELFALFTLAGHQARFFCSADPSDEPPTSEQEIFVASFVEASLRAAFDYLAETDAVEDFVRESALTFGSIHDKWSRCLRALPFAGQYFPVLKVLLPPSAARQFAEGATDDKLPPGARMTRLETGDLEMAVSYNKVQRPVKYVESRIDQSVCIRVPGPDGGEVPAGWVLIHADSSLGQLHVVEAFQHRGLGGQLMRRIVALRLTRGGKWTARVSAGEPEDFTNGWQMLDVVAGNTEAAAFYERLEGWEKAWVTAWMRFTAPS
ncbi:uncharacterized protein B0H18DRAFT_999714 [Fomitopsis serialis]|uniref:uncharacterized protein n=1 Tax=Fomitopsis serialis TaxID=139415 RepID=UPI00200814C1|nr:uncharacterized protein B0H18DRAFT_999714 [Neoantrodia serialis]KAH9928617.1 hypothetical protein B0H18DRAFT_999714 [Neoantrodia serialis]